MTQRMKRALMGFAVALLIGVGLGYTSLHHPTHPTATQTAPTVTAPAATAPAAVDPNAPASAAVLPPDLCSAIKATGTKTVAPSGGPGFPDEGFDVDDTPTQGDAPQPANPVQKVCENGRIQIQVGALPHFGHRIGDISNVRVIIVTDPDVTIDFTSLTKARALAFGGSDFVLAKDDAVEVQQVKRDKKVLYVVDLKLQTFVPKDPGVTFNLDLRYATSFVPGTKNPDWKVLSTPDMLITRSNTVDNGQDMLEGDLQPHTAFGPWAVWPVLIGGFFCILVWPGLYAVQWLNRHRPGRRIPANEIAWKKFNRTIRDANRSGWDMRHYRQLAAAVRIGLGYQAQTRLEILSRVRADARLAPKFEVIKHVLVTLDAVLYDGRVLSAEETEQLVRELPEVVARPSTL